MLEIDQVGPGSLAQGRGATRSPVGPPSPLEIAAGTQPACGRADPALPLCELSFILADGRELLARQDGPLGGLRIVQPELLRDRRLLSCSGRFAPLQGAQRWRWLEAELEDHGREPLWVCSSVQLLES